MKKIVLWGLLAISLPAHGVVPPNLSPELAKVRQITGQFKAVELRVDLSALPEAEKRALAKMVEAARILDTIFLNQVWAGNEPLLYSLSNDSSPLGRARLHAFQLEKGPWDRVNGGQAFLDGVPEKPAGGNFYPAGASKDEVAAWMKKLSPSEKARASGFFTTVRRSPDGKFVTVPYSQEYQGQLQIAAQLLRAAAELTQQPTLKHFLNKRADAFLSNDYYDSDVACMELDASIDPTIGPYEVYEDGWFNYKAAFESFINVRDDAETKKLSRFSGELQDLENHLPIEPKFRNPKIGALAPIRVVNTIFCSGDANHGVQTVAYNLPNDERISQEKGTKRVMLKNVQEAKFHGILEPIAGLALSSVDRKNVAFDAFFTHILMHEIMHGLGPHNITVGVKSTTVREALEDSYSAFEEAKADISGLWALQYLVDKGVIDKRMEQTMYTTFLASAFRSIRFGVGEAHGKGQAMQINYLTDAGGIQVQQSGLFTIDPLKIKTAVMALAHDILTIQATGDRKRAKEMLDRLGVVRPEVQKIIERLKSLPVDIEPVFTTANQLH